MIKIILIKKNGEILPMFIHIVKKIYQWGSSGIFVDCFLGKKTNNDNWNPAKQHPKKFGTWKYQNIDILNGISLYYAILNKRVKLIYLYKSIINKTSV